MDLEEQLLVSSALFALLYAGMPYALSYFFSLPINLSV
jgi:hypothetical protein